MDKTTTLFVGDTTNSIRLDDTLLGHDVAMDTDLSGANELELCRVLGRGGMGVVYLGRQSAPPRDVAVKRTQNLHPKLQKLLLHEAFITGMLEHPNIVPIHEIRFSPMQEVSVVMKRIYGIDLQQFLQKKHGQPGVLEHCLEALVKVCNALSFAHDKGIVHRDVKAQNIMMGDFGEVYLVDWGISVQISKPTSFPEGVVGTPAYMAPEMLSGRPCDVTSKTDVYLVGATLHEILMGVPRHQSTGSELQEEIRESNAFVYPPEVPKVLARLANDCCRPDAADRLKNVDVIRKRIKKYLRKQSALELLETGQREFALVRALQQKPEKTPRDKLQLYHHIHRARFGFERALLIDRELTSARESLQQLVDELTLMLLEEGNQEAASWFVESIGKLSPEVRVKLEAAQRAAVEARVEAERLQVLGRENDPRASLRPRILLAVTVCSCATIVAFYILRALFFPSEITAESLFIESLFFLVPFGFYLIIGGRQLVFDAAVRRVSIGLVTGIIGFILFRGAGMHLDLAPVVVVTMEKFLIAMAFANSQSMLPSGMTVALICTVIALLNMVIPSTVIAGSALMILCIVAFVSRDIYHELRQSP